MTNRMQADADLLRDLLTAPQSDSWEKLQLSVGISAITADIITDVALMCEPPTASPRRGPRATPLLKAVARQSQEMA